MADLFWFPFFAKQWLSSRARLSMNPAQRGAYIDFLAVAWGEGATEPCLESSPEILRGLSGLGDDWDRLSPLVLKQFEERDGMLYNVFLSGVWTKAQGKHAKAVANGKKGGKKKAALAKGKRNASGAKATLASDPSSEPLATLYQSQEAVSLTEKQASLSGNGLEAAGGALALNAPAPSEHPIEDRGRVTDGKPTPFREMVAQAMANLRPRVA